MSHPELGKNSQAWNRKHAFWSRSKPVYFRIDPCVSSLGKINNNISKACQSMFTVSIGIGCKNVFCALLEKIHVGRFTIRDTVLVLKIVKAAGILGTWFAADSNQDPVYIDYRRWKKFSPQGHLNPRFWQLQHQSNIRYQKIPLDQRNTINCRVNWTVLLILKYGSRWPKTRN